MVLSRPIEKDWKHSKYNVFERVIYGEKRFSEDYSFNTKIRKEEKRLVKQSLENIRN